MARQAKECPFSWTEQEKGCWIFKETIYAPVPCREDACKLWTGTDCVFNVIADRLADLSQKFAER